MAYAVTDPPPDLEAHVYGQVADLGGMKVWAVDSAPQLHAVFERTVLQVDTRASSKEKTRTRAYAARSRLLALGDASWDGGAVAGVEVITGPSWLPDENGAPRYVMRVAVVYGRTT